MQKNGHNNCWLTKPKVSVVLDNLHQEAERDTKRFVKMGLSILTNMLTGQGLPKFGGNAQEQAHKLKGIYFSISREQGAFAYLVARSIGARRIVEFGTSFGISTIYLAAAVKDNGGGIVIGSEIEADKAAQASANLQAAGLGDYVDIRLGDAMKTLANPGGAVDMVLMDGWKNLYLPLIKMLTPQLRPGAVVLSDNVTQFKKTLAPYVAYMSDPRNGFQSVTLPLASGFAYSVRI